MARTPAICATSRTIREENAVTAGQASTDKPSAPRVRRERVKRALHRRAGRIRVLLLVLALLLPLLITLLFGRH
jgi:hypothetical protein